MSETQSDWHSLHIEIAAPLWDVHPDVCQACDLPIQGGVQLVIGCIHCEIAHMLHPRCAPEPVWSIIPDLSKMILRFAADLN